MAKKNKIFIGSVEADTESPEKKKNRLDIKSKSIIWGALALVAAISIFTTYKYDSTDRSYSGFSGGKALTGELVVDAEDKDIWRLKTQEKIEEMMTKMEETQQQNEKISQESLDEIAALKKALEESKKESEKLKEELTKTSEVVTKVKKGVDDKDEQLKKQQEAGKPKIPGVEERPYKGSQDDAPYSSYKMPDPNVSPGKAPPPPRNPFAPITVKKIDNKPEIEEKALVIGGENTEDKGPDALMLAGISQQDASDYLAEEAKLKTKMVNGPKAGWLPDGAFAKIAVISGLDAGAGADTQKNPQPVLMRIQSDAKIPSMNGIAKYKLKGCFLVGSAYGDISSERVMIKPTRLSCLNQRNGYVLSASVSSGYISDFDNVAGLRGKVEYRDGARIGNAVLASSIGALASVGQIGAGASTATIGAGVVPSFATGEYDLPSSGQIGASVLGETFSNSAEIIAKRYADQASNIFPIVALPGGRKGTVVFTAGMVLKWESMGKVEVPVEETTTTQNPTKGSIIMN